MCSRFSCAHSCRSEFSYAKFTLIDVSQIQFMSNHHLLQITGKPSWLTLKGGRYAVIVLKLHSIWLIPYYNSRVYVNQIISNLPKSQLHLSTPVTSVSAHPQVGSSKSPVTLKTSDGRTETFDHIILACHSDTALELLRAGDSGTTVNEEQILGAFKWNRNEAVLHSDIEVSLTCVRPQGKVDVDCVVAHA